MLEIRFLGKFDVRIDGRTIEIPSRKGQSLFAFLVLNPGIQHRREKVAGMLWPNSEETKARNKLRYTLWQLRQAIGDQYLLTDKISLAYDPGSDNWFDVSVLEEKQTERLTTEELQRVVSLYEGDLLPGFYEDWVLLERERLQASFEQKMQVFLQRLMDEERWNQSLEWAEKWISMGQTPEPAFRALMVAQSQLGDIAGAASTYKRCELALSEQLGVEPSEETKRIYELISRGEKPDTPKFESASVVPPSQPLFYHSPPFLETIQEQPEVGRSVFVAREGELAWLEEKLDKTINGHGQVVFVTGDAGQGKTALLHEFSRRAQRLHDELVVALGSGEAQIGIGDPHLPFRDILALLTGDVEAKWTKGAITQENARRLWSVIPQAADAIVNLGLDLIDSFVSGESMWAHASKFAPEGAQWLERLETQIKLRRDRPIPVNVDHGNFQKDLFDQYTKVMQSLARQQPLMLVLDDLQWADLGSISLLFHLGRRIEGHRILILGAYRPDDVAQTQDGEQHPLIQVLMEFKRIFGENEINLDETDVIERRKFIDAFLDTEPNRLGEEFRKLLNQHTAGHPLFTIELLRQMEAQGDLRKNEGGYWTVSPALGWENLPAKVEAVIERRISRLPASLRDILNVASVEGQEFTAEVIATITGVEKLEIIRKFSRELDKQHLLVEASGIRRIGQQSLSLYQFRHNLFQKYIYDNLDEVERVYFHEQVGKTTEKLYKGHLEQVSVRLARHFKAAGITDKAIDYLLQAADKAKRLSANEEAVNHLTLGLDFLKELPEGIKRNEKELSLQIAFGPPLVATKGYSATEVEQTYERARALCEQIGDIHRLAPALWGLCGFYQVRGKNLTAHEQAEHILVLAKAREDPQLFLLAHWMLGLTFTHLGEFLQAREHLELALEYYDPERHHSLTYLYGQNPGVTCLNYLALALWILGYPDQAQEKCKGAIALSEKASHPYSEAFAHSMAALFHAMKRDPEAALKQSEEAIRLSSESGFPFLLAVGLIIRGWARISSGKTGMAIKLMRKGIETIEVMGAELGGSFFLSLLAEGYGEAGEMGKGLQVLDQALHIARVNEEHWNESDLYRLKGVLLEKNGEAESEITASYRRAIQIANKQEARSWQLRAATAITKVGERSAQPGMERDELTRIYERFSEGFETIDLREARELLDKES
jgi:predicted ATPase/DNA-binding SARP family transcriptional activator